MSAILGSCNYEMDVVYAADFSRDREPIKKRSRHPEYQRKGSAPTRVNGMHCRRNKRWSWGTGRGARMANLRAFASCLAVAVSVVGTNASAVTLDFATIGNPGNSNNIVSGTNFGGAVARTFLMSKTETTNSQYVEFLNAVDSAGANAKGLYNTTNASNALYGIALNSGAPSGSKYSVKVGSPSGAPAGTTYANMPVNFTNWFSAARYVNWIAGGQLSGTAGTVSMEGGFAGSPYTLAGGTSGNIVTRNAGATFFLPSADEWYKAAFFRPTAVTGSAGVYTRYPTNNDSLPAAVAVTTGTGSNVGNFANVANTTGPNPVQVGAYVNAMSAYGLYDMLGNVSEMSDTAGSAGTYRVPGGGYNAGASLASWNSLSNAVFTSSSTANLTSGFRVAAAVPEPGTIALAATGMFGMFGAGWMKRRKRQAQLLAAAKAIAA